MTLMPWSEQEIRSFASIGTGAKDTKDRVMSGKYPFFVRSQNVERIDSWSFDGEAVLTAGDGVGTGKVFHYIDGKFDYHQRVYRISNFRADVAGRYFFHQFSRNFLARIESLTAKSSVDSVRMETIAGMRIPVPERAEQDRIVRAIDDAGDLIATLERLIAKKEAIKQGMMQQLLGGQSAPQWPAEEIRAFASIGTGSKDTKDRVSSGCYPFFVRSQHVEHINSWSFDGEAVLTAGDGVGTGKVFHYINGRFDYHQRVYRISNFREDVSGRYFFHQFSRNFLARIESLTAKSSVDSVRMESIAGMQIPIPERSEQDRIAAMIDDAELEIKVLRTRLEKAKSIKTGMMQQLLTGRMRLPAEAVT